MYFKMCLLLDDQLSAEVVHCTIEAALTQAGLQLEKNLLHQPESVKTSSPSAIKTLVSTCW